MIKRFAMFSDGITGTVKFWLICSLDLYTHNKLVTLQLNCFNWVHWLDDIPCSWIPVIKAYIYCAIHTTYKPSTTFPSESVLQAFISPDALSAEYISKQYWKEVRWGELKSCQFITHFKLLLNGDSRNCSYSTKGGMDILTPPCHWKF